MYVRQRLTPGPGMILALFVATAVPIPAQSGAAATSPVAQIVDDVPFREIGPTGRASLVGDHRGR